jgi:hypothetical protein
MEILEKKCGRTALVSSGVDLEQETILHLVQGRTFKSFHQYP